MNFLKSNLVSDSKFLFNYLLVVCACYLHFFEFRSFKIKFVGLVCGFLLLTWLIFCFRLEICYLCSALVRAFFVYTSVVDHPNALWNKWWELRSHHSPQHKSTREVSVIFKVEVNVSDIVELEGANYGLLIWSVSERFLQLYLHSTFCMSQFFFYLLGT